MDTLGAGDVLHGALAAWLAVLGRDAGDAPVTDALAWAATAASASCAAPGARGWLADTENLAALRAALRP